LVPTLHCLSSLVERQFVDDLSGMLTALEAGIAAGTTDGWPIDRHITAFIAARTPESIDSQLSSLNSNDLGTRWGTTARMFATLQEASGPAMLPGLTRAMASLGSPLIDRFHNRATRKKLRAGLNDVVNLGRLKLLVDYLDDEDALKRDHMRFERAKAGFKGTQKGLEGCDQAMADLTARSIHVGATICVTVSAVLSTAIVMVSMLAMGIF